MSVERAGDAPRPDLMTIERLLLPLLSHRRVAHAIKYVVYLSLVGNGFYYLYNDYHAMLATLPPDAALTDYLMGFITSIDTVAWLGLVFLLELETYAVPDEKWTAWLARTIHLLRLACYLAIGYAAYGYTAESLENYSVTEVEGVTQVCELADQGVSIQLNVIDYVEITSENCAGLSDQDRFYRIANEVSVIDEPTLEHIRFQGWVDVDNALVWLVVVFLIEIEVWLLNRDRTGGTVIRVVRQAKSFFYLMLIANIVIWWIDGYYMYAWDAFVWIFGFWAIELNMAEWESSQAGALQPP